MGEQGGHPRPCLRGNRVRRRAFGRASGHRVHAGRLDDADMERELSGACIVVDATHPFATLASGSIRAASLAVGARACALRARSRRCPKASCRSRRSPARRAFSPRTRVVRFSAGSKACSLHERRRFRGALLRACAPAARCYNEVHRRGVFAVARHRHAGPFTRELNEAMLRQVGAQWLVTKDSGTVGGTAEKLAAARATWERAASWSPVPPREAGPFRFGKWKTRSYGSSRARRLPRLRALPTPRRSVPSKLDPYKPVIHQ